MNGGLGAETAQLFGRMCRASHFDVPLTKLYACRVSLPRWVDNSALRSTGRVLKRPNRAAIK
jgi:hypothetical protein